jgi:hypothetical protein
MGNRCLAVEQYRESYQAASVHPAGIPNRAATPSHAVAGRRHLGRRARCRLAGMRTGSRPATLRP